MFVLMCVHACVSQLETILPQEFEAELAEDHQEEQVGGRQPCFLRVSERKADPIPESTHTTRTTI